MRRTGVLAAICLMALAGCSGGSESSAPCRDPTEITEEMARATGAREGILPLFTSDAKFVRHVAVNELDHRGQMVARETRRLLAVPVKDEKGKTFALRQYDYTSNYGPNCGAEPPGGIDPVAFILDLDLTW